MGSKYGPDSENIEQIYKIYPLKRGGWMGKQKLSKIIKTEKQYLEVLIAVGNFAEWCKKTNCQFIPHFSTFVNQRRWVDFIDYPATSTGDTADFKSVFKVKK